MRQWLKLLLLIPIFGACSTTEIEIDGVVKVKGSAPHTYLVIEDSKSKEDFKILNAKEFNLFKKQNQTIKAKIEIKQKKIGATFPTVAKIIEIK